MEKTFCGPAVSICGEVLQLIIARKMLFTAAHVRDLARTTSIQHNQLGNLDRISFSFRTKNSF